MLRRLLITATLTISAGQAFADSLYSTIYSFGDSLSDVGNVLISTSQPGSLIPPQPLPPYSNGRFTNGNVWVQDLSQVLGLGPVMPSLAGGNDYAWGGATTGFSGTLDPTKPVPTLVQQVDAFLPSPSSVAPSTALYTFSIGANDLFAILGGKTTDGLTPMQNAAAAAQVVATEAGDLQAAGAKDLMLFDVPDLGLTPGVTMSGPDASAEASALSAYFDEQVLIDLAPVEAAGLKVFDLNTYALIDEAVNDPGEFGFNDVTDPCYVGPTTGGGAVCSLLPAVQDTYLFWDDVHPTARGHMIIADDALRALGVAVPEPSTWAMMVLGLAGLAAFRARKGREAPVG